MMWPPSILLGSVWYILEGTVRVNSLLVLQVCLQVPSQIRDLLLDKFQVSDSPRSSVWVLWQRAGGGEGGFS